LQPFSLSVPGLPMANLTADSTRNQLLEKPLPHSADTERAILGAIILDNGLINQAIEQLKPEDFYLQAHRNIFRAMTGLSERGGEINPITLAEELRRDGLIDQVGGVAAISDLTYGLPHFTNITHYSEIVRGKSLLRRLIKASNKITSEALEEEDEPAVILDHAEQAIFALAEERSREGFTHVKPIADNILEKVQEMSGRSVMLTGLTTGFTELDAMTSGLQPSDLIIVAARPSVGKTAFCLTLAQNAAIKAKAVVGIFSLEMSKESLVMRMLCSEGQVDAHRFRTGFLAREEWGRLARALGTLAEAKIFIDDTPGISVLEMRAKARRLAAEQKKLDLIIVDYLQLMTGSRRTDSRQQEVSQISRELKGLAKELNVPLIALSQLSRAPEARSDHTPMLSDLRESGCIDGDSLITLADTGERVPIRDLVGRSDFAVWSMNERTFKIERSLVSKVFATGLKPTFVLTTKLGRSIKVTGNHKFYTFDGWKRLDELKEGELIALPRKISNDSPQTMSDSELALLGHLIGDGCTLPRHCIQYTTNEFELAEIVSSLTKDIFCSALRPRIAKEKNWFQVYLSSSKLLTHNVRNEISIWLDSLGIWGLRSYEKYIPNKLFEQPDHAIATFLRHLWATDGSISMRKVGLKLQPNIYYATSSSRLSFDVQSLLLRLGINARVVCVDQHQKGRMQHHVIVSGREDTVAFIERIGAIGTRRNKSVDEIREYLEKTVANTNRDILPQTIWKKYVVPAMKLSGVSARSLMRGIDCAYCGTQIYKQNVSRERASRLAKVVDSQELLYLSTSDIYWDKVIHIKSDQPSPVYDMTVPGNHNFIANNIIVHNSIEQDADVVAFIFREEQYNRTEENAGVADIIVAKQRNGPTGTVKLAFLKEFTRFENLYPE
jgi:replicative DNA helicase